MKFISKNSNLRVVLKPGLSAEPLAGRPAVHGVYVKFEDGVANILDEGTIDLMLKHPAFNVDFIAGDEVQKDPFVRRPSEPEHQMMEINYGHAGKVTNPTTPITNLPPELKKAITDLAMGMAKEMTEKAVKEVLTTLKGAVAEAKQSEKESAPAAEEKTAEEAVLPEGASLPDFTTPKKKGGSKAKVKEVSEPQN